MSHLLFRRNIPMELQFIFYRSILCIIDTFRSAFYAVMPFYTFKSTLTALSRSKQLLLFIQDLHSHRMNFNFKITIPSNPVSVRIHLTLLPYVSACVTCQAYFTIKTFAQNKASIYYKRVKLFHWVVEMTTVSFSWCFRSFNFSDCAFRRKDV